MMIRHNLKIAFRNLLKYKVQMGISIIGLSVGFVCLSLSLLWIRYETSYDSFHKGVDRIYLAGGRNILESDMFHYLSDCLLYDYLVKNCPEIEAACRIRPIQSSNEKLKYKDTEFQLPQIEVDSSAISMFNITVLDGNTPLHLNANQIAITERAARQIFGKESPIGKQLVFPEKQNEEKTIVAVVQSWEGPSLFPFDILLPFDDESIYNVYTLFRVYPNSNLKALEKKLENVKVLRNGVEWPLFPLIVKLTELRELHPDKNVNVKMNHIRMFASIGALVIICGLCNYLTMFITRIRMRKRELALRKVNGASNKSLLTLILSELLLLLCISLGIGCMLIELILPTFKKLSQINESTSFFYIEILTYMIVLIGLTTIIAVILIHYFNKRTLSDSISHKSDIHFSSWFYKACILFQLFIGIGFVFCTLVMMKQLDFLLNTNELGLDRHNVGAILKMRDCEDIPWETILDQNPDVIKHLEYFPTPIPKSSVISSEISDWDGKSIEEQPIEVENMYINQEYIDFFGIKLVEGSMPEKETDILINETAVKALGWKDPINKKIINTNVSATVKGVIKDIYLQSPMYPILPTIYSIDQPYTRYKIKLDYLFKVKEGTWNKVSKQLSEELKKACPNTKLRLVNLDEVYKSYMKSEQNLIVLLSVVSVICIIISVFGVFSLVTLSCQQRRKEIAIRKVNGASVGIILNMFFKEYILLLIISSCIAFSIGYVIMKHWLEGYMKQTSITWWLLGGIFVLMALIIFLCIIWRIWKTARQNPAEVIKKE